MTQLSLEKILKNCYCFLLAHLMQAKSTIFYLHINAVIYSRFSFDYSMNQYPMTPPTPPPALWFLGDSKHTFFLNIAKKFRDPVPKLPFPPWLSLTFLYPRLTLNSGICLHWYLPVYTFLTSWLIAYIALISLDCEAPRNSYCILFLHSWEITSFVTHVFRALSHSLKGCPEGPSLYHFAETLAISSTLGLMQLLTIMESLMFTGRTFLSGERVLHC